ncbi:DUF2079 domain-containing protein [Candidatus Roizmanbacteria bacterium]|nr:DUF2079 domain-containing protein [Candidatus Roizmanbacteria bacterium]
MFTLICKYKIQVLLGVFLLAYVFYFSSFSILRYRTLYASYYDLGIMHQTVFNTYQALVHLDPSRILEMTNPEGVNQIKRMAIHNDPILAFMAPFYFLWSGPETLLIIQTIILAIGALAVYLIAQRVFHSLPQRQLFSFLFAIAYLLYTPMERANLFDFHGVTLATSFLLFMIYFWLVRNYRWSAVFFLLSLLCKEQVALTTGMFGLFMLYTAWKQKSPEKSYCYPFIVLGVSSAWFLVSLLVIIPHFRGSNHFALGYYGDFGESPMKVMVGVFHNPLSLGKYLSRPDTWNYFYFLLGPLAFLSVLSPLRLLIAAPEFAINLLSQNWNMRNIIFHYTSVIQPFVFFSAIYGFLPAYSFLKKNIKTVRFPFIIGGLILVATLFFSATKGPLPYSVERELYPILYPQPAIAVVHHWALALKDESIKVSSYGHIAPFFTSRRYYYPFSEQYDSADYVVIQASEVYNSSEQARFVPILEKLKADSRYQSVFSQDEVIVFQRKPL